METGPVEIYMAFERTSFGAAVPNHRFSSHSLRRLVTKIWHDTSRVQRVLLGIVCPIGCKPFKITVMQLQRHGRATEKSMSQRARFIVAGAALRIHLVSLQSAPPF